MAARSFREHGGDISGIGTVMKKVGLTKGGFYRHFKSKDDLFVEAVARAFDEMGSGMLEIAKSVPEGQALRAIIEHYLSPRHANSPGMGCVLSALGPELARKPLSVRKRIEASREAYRERLLPFVPGQTREEKVAKFQLLFPSMAGVLTAVRMTLSPQRREQMLIEARNFFIKCFAKGNFFVRKEYDRTLSKKQNDNKTKLRDKPMKLMIPFLVSALPAASVAQSQPSPQPNNFNLPFVLSVIGAFIASFVVAMLYAWPTSVRCPGPTHYESSPLCMRFGFWG